MMKHILKFIFPVFIFAFCTSTKKITSSTGIAEIKYLDFKGVFHFDLIKYANEIKAPKKEFIKFEKSGHSPVFEEPKRFNEEILRIYQSLDVRNR